jgi:hypothetical protein
MDDFQRLLQPSVQAFLLAQEGHDAATLALRGSPFAGIPTTELITQLAGRQKAKTKLPLWFGTPEILYPPGQSMEQCSSEAASRFKSSLVEGAVFADLCSGFGVDAYFMSKRFAAGYSVEANADLLRLQAHNLGRLRGKNLTYVRDTAANFLRTVTAPLDWIYLDPSRRKGSKRVRRFEDCEPNVIALMDDLLRAAPRVMIKASPMLDITAGINSLKSVSRVIVVEHEHECRELIFILNRDFEGEPVIESVVLMPDREPARFSSTPSEEASATISFSDPQEWIYEPSPALLKAAPFRLLASRFGLRKLAPNTHLYTSDVLVPGFPGRVFRRIIAVKPSPGAVRPHFPEGMALAISRNHPLSAEALLKKCKLRQGGTRYLIALRGRTQAFVLVAEKLLS